MSLRKSNTNHSTSRNYELLIRNLIEQEMSGISGIEFVEVLHNVKMKGLSGYEHQIDVAYRFRIWETEMLVIVECKQYQKKVGVDDLLEFRARIEDIRAHKGIFVTSSDFQSGAVEFAEANRIALLIIRGTKRRHVAYYLIIPSPEVRCKRQIKRLRHAYHPRIISSKSLTLDLILEILHDLWVSLSTVFDYGFNSRVSVDHARSVVVVSHDNVRIIIAPEELDHCMLYREECELERRDSDELFFSSVRFPHLRTNKLLKSVILDELLTS